MYPYANVGTVTILLYRTDERSAYVLTDPDDTSCSMTEFVIRAREPHVIHVTESFRASSRCYDRFRTHAEHRTLSPRKGVRTAVIRQRTAMSRKQIRQQRRRFECQRMRAQA